MRQPLVLAALVGAPHFAPTDPKTVEIMRSERLRDEGAKLGASAVVVVFNKVQPNGAYVTGGWYTRSVQVTEGRKIVGVAIRNR